MKYKVGDKVRIKSLDWYNQMLAIKDKHAYRTASNGCEFIGVWCGNRIFKNDMIKFCGQVMTIKAIENEYYVMHEDTSGYWYCDEMIECLVEEETLIERFDDNGLPFNEWLSHRGFFHIPEGYILKDENDNVINATKIVLEKKKKEYPKTYEECCNILSITDADYHIRSEKGGTINQHIFSTLQMINTFTKLIICREAYWKIAGEEMGLETPWEPDYTNTGEKKFAIWFDFGEIKTGGAFTTTQMLLSFPTAEMRDAFKENFDPDIKKCKMFL